MDKAGMEMDLAIALFVKEQQERAEEEKRARIWEKIDPKARIKYTVEELAEGIRQAVPVHLEDGIYSQRGAGGALYHALYQGFLRYGGRQIGGGYPLEQ